MQRVDVVIVGGGPAGATAALNLAALRRVVVLERAAEPSPRIGESLPAAARRLFRDMGLLDSFLAEPHAPCFANRSVWGAATPLDADAVRDPDGHGWHLDRRRFEAWLRAAAMARGAQILAPAGVDCVERAGDRVRVTAGSQRIEASVIIDAGGRNAPAARRLGARVRIDDHLVCGWVHGTDARDGGRGLTYVEATRDGWWYTAPLPDRRRVLAFHTDADLPAAAITHDGARLVAEAAAVGGLASLLAAAGFTPEDRAGFTAAHSSVLEPPCGEGFIAAGDAAIAFDPLSSQGLLNALFTGLAAAECADAYLSGDASALPRYRATLDRIAVQYRRHLAEWYAIEQRWPDAPFWSRRHAVGRG